MKRLNQSVSDIVGSLSNLDPAWEDPTAAKAAELLAGFPIKAHYASSDIIGLLQQDFDVGLLVCRLFLGYSDDKLNTFLIDKLGDGGIGITRFKKDPRGFVRALERMDLLSAMEATANRKPIWSDILVERLRSSRGRAIAGQKRGLFLEEFGEKIVKSIFAHYEVRCKFVGANGVTAKCDFAIPNKKEARILIESKGYGATGSKMSDVIGDLSTIIGSKRHDTTLLFLTDGVTWKQRLSDLGKIVEMQNQGKIARIYTTKMEQEFASDLKQLKTEHALE